MKITSSRIKALLTIGESQGIEFKRASDGPKADTFESVCAFLNKTGGDLFLGVEDDIFRLIVPLDSRYSAEMFSPETTTLKTTLKTTPKTTLKERDQKIIGLLQDRPEASISEIAEATGLTRDGVNNAIRRLKRIAGVARVGGRKFGHWEVKESTRK